MDESSGSQASSGGIPPEVSIANPHRPDPPVTAATAGYRLNHFMLRIRDPKASLHFYIDLMGLRTVLSINLGLFSIYYLSYPQTDEHRADLAKFSLDTCMNIPNTLGMLELVHNHGSEDQPADLYQSGNSPPNLGFGHLGFTVPDVSSAVERLRSAGVEVIKEPGINDLGSVITAEEMKYASGGRITDATLNVSEGMKNMYSTIAFVKDPDGYFVELVSGAASVSS